MIPTAVLEALTTLLAILMLAGGVAYVLAKVDLAGDLEE